MRGARHAAVALALAVAACTTASRDVPVRTQVVRPASYPVGTAFRWVDDDIGRYPALARAVREAVARELAARGYRLGGENARYGIRASVRFASTTAAESGYRHGTYEPGATQAPLLRRGTLTLEVISLPGGEPLWRGALGGLGSSPVEAAGRAAEAVHRILAEFPPVGAR